MADTPGSALSTHVLNNAEGIPAAGVAIELWRLDPEPCLVITTETNADGRARDLLLPPGAFRSGRYELRFHIGAYFQRRGLAPDPLYLDVVPVRIGLQEGAGHYHVPLLCTPWSYTTYRGS